MSLDSRVEVQSAVMREIIHAAIECGASDVHFKSGLPPVFRVAGKLTTARDIAPISAATIRSVLYSMITSEQQALFEHRLELDVAVHLTPELRGRLNLYNDIDTPGGALRLIPSVIPSLEELGAPPIVAELTKRKSGLILVTGVTGAGKTTLLAAMIDSINQRESRHIYTIEDPIEFVHKSARSLVTQREIGQSTLGFDRAVRSSLRADPNVLMVGEMRDRETVLAVLEAAETGLLVLSTLHTNSAIKSVQRILSLSNQNEKDALRVQLSNILQAVICQQLVPLIDGGRRAVHEVMVKTASVTEAIELGEYDKLEEYIKNGSFDGMQTMDESLHQLFTEGHIEADTAVAAAVNQESMTRALRGAS